MATHELKAEVMAYSSVVGSGVLLFNERGQMLGQIAFLCQADELREKAFQERLASVISNAINADTAATQPTPQERREWNPSDGDRICQKCGTDNPVWFAPSPIWNCLMGGPDATDDPGGVLCPTCFMALDDDQIWEVRPKAQTTPQEAAKVLVEWLNSDRPNAPMIVACFTAMKQPSGDFDKACALLRAIAGEDKADG